MALRVKAKVKVGTRVSNFRFQSQLHRLLEGGFRGVSGFWPGVQTLSTKQTVVNFWQGKYFFPFRLFALQEAHLARTSVDFYSILLSNANGCSCTSPPSDLLASCNYIGFGQILARRAARRQGDSVFPPKFSARRLECFPPEVPPRNIELKLGQNRFHNQILFWLKAIRRSSVMR